MGSRLGTLCPIAGLLLLCCGLAAAASVGFVASALPKFLDEDGGQRHVLAFSTSPEEQPPSAPHRTLLMRSANGTRYRCYLPAAEGASSGSSSGSGSSSSATSLTTVPQQGSLAPQKKPTELLDALGERCYYYYDEWWTYELCYKKHVRQYHKGQDGQLEAEYLLGVYDELEQPEDEDEVQVDTTDVSGRMRYVSQLYSGGEACELTDQQRSAEVRYTCSSDSSGTRLAGIKEPATCRYVITVSTPRLCKHPAFQDRPPSAQLIACHPLPPGEQDGVAAAAGQCSAAAAAGGQCGAAAAAAGGGLAGSRGGDDAAAAAYDNLSLGLGVGLDGGMGEDAEEEEEEGAGLLTSLVEGEGDDDEDLYTDETAGDDDADDDDPYE